MYLKILQKKWAKRFEKGIDGILYQNVTRSNNLKKERKEKNQDKTPRGKEGFKGSSKVTYAHNRDLWTILQRQNL